MVLLACAALFAVAGCSGIQVRQTEGSEASIAGYTTYSWAADGPASPEDPEAWSRRELSREIRVLVDRALEVRGFRLVDREEADLLVEERTSIEERVQQRDPYFSFDTVRKIEVGTLTLQMLDGRTRGVLWSASAKSDLREVARGFGLVDIRYEPIDEPRDWKLQEKVDEMMSRIPPRARS
jgi:hypothetical protein